MIRLVYAPTDEYIEKLTSPSKALAGVRPGDRIFTGTGCAEPTLLNLHLSNMLNIEDTVLLHFYSFGSAPYIKEQFTRRFRYHSFFITDNIREAVHSGRADYTPVSVKHVPRLFAKRILPVDVALIQTSIPDVNGQVSLGISVDVTKAAVRNSRLVIAEVNREMPITHGNSKISISEINYFIENNSPLIERVYSEPSQQVKRVAKNVTSLIDDGSTIQFGIGNVPNAVPLFLHEKLDLGIYTETFSDTVLDLIQSGAVTNEKKPIHNGMSVASYVTGSHNLYKTIDDNPKFGLFPSDYVLNTDRIGQHPNMISINSALEIDVTGQVVADSLGTKQYSGIGGAVDFHRGALRSQNGKAIIALPSASNDGKHTRIVCTLSKGSGVTIDRSHIAYVVTEYGVAYIRGLPLRERVLKMIEISHPSFRKQLFEHAKNLGYLYEDQIFHETQDWMLYPQRLQKSFMLKNNTPIRIRPLLPSDEDKLRDFFYSLSEKSKYSRYFNAINALPHSKAQTEANIDFSQDFGFAAFVNPINSEEIIGTGHFFLLRDGESAEIALLTSEKYRGNGIARRFLSMLSKIACDRGVKHFISEVIIENKAAYHLFKTFSENGPAVNPKIEREGGIVTFLWDIPE